MSPKGYRRGQCCWNDLRAPRRRWMFLQTNPSMMCATGISTSIISLYTEAYFCVEIRYFRYFVPIGSPLSSPSLLSKE